MTKIEKLIEALRCQEDKEKFQSVVNCATKYQIIDKWLDHIKKYFPGYSKHDRIASWTHACFLDLPSNLRRDALEKVYDNTTCPVCNGEGHIKPAKNNIYEYKDCSLCNGKGFFQPNYPTKKRACIKCGGSGIERKL